MFTDRKEAGRELAEKLKSYRGKDAVVLALPRGGVVTGYEIAHALSLPLDIIAVRKIGHPSDPEYAIGAVDEHGTTIFNDAEAERVPQKWLTEETLRQKKEAERRSSLYRDGREPLKIEGKIVIIADDGIATGFTMQIAVRFVKKQKPARIIVAAPVASFESVRTLKEEGAHEVIILKPPEEFRGSIGAHYTAFEQMEDEEVIRLLRMAYH